MKVRAAILSRMGAPAPYADSRPIAIETIELDPPGPGEVLVKVAAAGLCHSDLSVVNGDRPRPLPMVLGHEASGVVAEVGPGVSDLSPGDHVVFVFVPSCGHCMPCVEGRPALCEPGAAANGAGTLFGGYRRLRSMGGAPINHQVGVSCFAEYAVSHRSSLLKVDPALALDVASLFSCAVVTGVGAVINCARVPLGATVAVVGLGGVGLSALLGARAAGASRVIAVDVLPSKLELARALGATDVWDANDPGMVDAIKAATRGGVEYAIEAASSIAALEAAYRITRRGGVTVTASLPHPAHHLQIPGVHLVAEERTLKGSYLGSSVPARDIPHFITLYQSGRLPVDRLISARIGLDDINAGFDRLARGEAVRQVIVFP